MKPVVVMGVVLLFFKYPPARRAFFLMQINPGNPGLRAGHLPPAVPRFRSTGFLHSQGWCLAYSRTLFIALALLGAAQAKADTIEINGFATLGAVYNPDDFVFTRSLEQPRGARGGWSSRPDSNLGLQLNWSPGEHWEVVLQGVTSHHYHDYRPQVTLAFARFQPSASWEFRGGRLGFDAYIGSDSRHVGYAHLPVRPPIEYFGVLELEYLDGLDVTWRQPLGNGLLTAKLLAGLADEKRVVDPGVEYDVSGSLNLGGYLLYQVGDWQFRGGVITTRLDKPLSSIRPLQAALSATGLPALAEVAGELPLEDSRITNWALEGHWNAGPLEAQLRLSHRESSTRTVPEGFNLMALVGYRLNSLTPYLGFASSDTRDTEVPAVLAADNPLHTVLRASNIEQRTSFLGLRWDIADGVATKLQLDRVHADDPLGGYYVVGSGGWDGHSTLFSATLELVF